MKKLNSHTFVMDAMTKRKLGEIAQNAERTRSAMLRFLINREWEAQCAAQPNPTQSNQPQQEQAS